MKIITTTTTTTTTTTIRQLYERKNAAKLSHLPITSRQREREEEPVKSKEKSPITGRQGSDERTVNVIQEQSKGREEQEQ